jgi:hypothetical protein
MDRKSTSLEKQLNSQSPCCTNIMKSAYSVNDLLTLEVSALFPEVPSHHFELSQLLLFQGYMELPYEHQM